MTPFHSLLKKLQEKLTFRSETLSLNASLTQKSFMNENQRKSVMPVVISVLYPKLSNKKGKKMKKNLESNKSIFFY